MTVLSSPPSEATSAPNPSDQRGERGDALRVQGLVVRYGTERAVDGIDFSVGRGEVFGLLGTNGAGKTTTLDVLEGFRAPTQGSVRVLGVDPFTERARIAPRIGIMLQDAGFFDDLTVRQTLRSWRRFYRDARGVEESLDLVGLGHRSSVRVKQLSGGERRRLDLALALLGNPSVLFLDEPTTGMDPEGRQRCLDIVRHLVADGLTVVLTTHYLEEAEQLADRIAIMHRGRIEAQGTLSEIVASETRTVIEFEVAADVDEALLLQGLTSTTRPPSRGRQRLQVESIDGQRDLARLLAAADLLGVRLEALTVSRPTLEDVFLALVNVQQPR